MIGKRIKLAIKGILFTVVTLTAVFAVNDFLTPKSFYNEMWSHSSTFVDFYKLEKNSVDVLFMGSSHAATSFNPQIIYDEYGITSYNLGCPQQSVFTTYYWLKEALKYQSPQVLVLETLTFHKYEDAYVYNYFNCSETSLRKAFDCMKTSPLKVELAKKIKDKDPSQSALSYFLMNIRYHSRWTKLSEPDYSGKALAAHGGVKGYIINDVVNKDAEDYTISTADLDTVTPEPMVKVTNDYLGKIVELCKENDIKLVFVKIPSKESIERYKATKECAEQYGVAFYDFNEETQYKEIGYSAEDLYGHPNYNGAAKITRYLGKVLLNDYGVKPREDSSYEKSGEYYKKRIKNIKLKETTDFREYLKMVNDDRYSVFLFAPLRYSDYIDDDLMELLHELGFKTELNKQDDDSRYYAVKDGGGVIEKLTDDDFSFSGSIRGGKTIYSFTVDTKIMLNSFQTFSMIVDGTEYGERSNGLNIVVYDNEQMAVIDKVKVDTLTKDCAMTHY